MRVELAQTVTDQEKVGWMAFGPYLGLNPTRQMGMVRTPP